MAVRFEEENNFNQLYHASIQHAAASGIAAWMIKQGYVKTEAEANATMIIVTIICFSLAIYLRIK